MNLKSTLLKPARLLCIVMVLGGLSWQLKAQESIDMDELINETQFLSDDPDAMRLVWYIPIEYWHAVFANDPSISEAEIKEIIDVLDEYEMFAVLDGTMGVFGNVKYKEKSETKRGLTLADQNGAIYYPLDESEINEETNTLMTLMQPILSSMIGAMGENMHFFMFKSKTSERLINPKEAGQFTLTLAEEPFVFELPLSALLPAKFCPVDNKTMKGTWKYCPFHGTELKDN
ncbi:hypothetical protein [Roseivirga sp.]|uniref:hypothetical protein n=1 Tax=Roseivirga sp. TaxID=1964215 RepID=UPI003B51B47A